MGIRPIGQQLARETGTWQRSGEKPDPLSLATGVRQGGEHLTFVLPAKGGQRAHRRFPLIVVVEGKGDQGVMEQDEIIRRSYLVQILGNALNVITPQLR